jgi:hypothetical protein
MNKLLAGAAVAAALAAGAGTAHAEACLWIGVWACGDTGTYYTHYYQLPNGPNMELRPYATPPMPVTDHP